MAADERALIRRQWHAPWAKRERAIHRLLWPGWPTALAVVAAIAAWVLHVLGEPVAALGALAVLLAASLWLVWQLHRRTATRQRVRATLQAAANALRSRGVSADVEPLLQWLEHHWAWDTPTALYGPKGVTVHCHHVAGQFAGRPVVVVQWSRMAHEVKAISSSLFADEEAYLPDHRTVESSTVHEAGWLVLVASPNPAAVSETTVHVGPFFVRSVPAGLEATSLASQQEPTWEDIRRILDAR